ncbi:ferrous iron transporter B [Erwinia sp. S63]|uniref:nucleoside recognition domain-containing protein n=1 Tax=Erwiniaceae TaxID=1903409 RepID=UPI00190BE538|nr:MULTISPECIES: nucleoside recognition domain-containing protein [Erwiniaceae]MBK0093598.1 ferrous iron transporter B [Erwinia sp. S59]MBK0099344.1 ferrous iron transporter B [Erwinia sp. S63]MBK0127334.1 ferrous iron transporter B [Pantoea sp. S61]
MTHFALIGLESAGKSSLFNLLTKSALSDERNIRGSTVFCREYTLEQGLGRLIDTPGIRYLDDNTTTEIALSALDRSDVIIVVIRATHALAEWDLLRQIVQRYKRRMAIVMTFTDKVTSSIETLKEEFSKITQSPIVALDTRHADENERQQLLSLLAKTYAQSQPERHQEQNIPVLDVTTETPQRTWFEHPYIGPLLSVICIALLYAFPVWLSWHISDALQPVADQFLIRPLAERLSQAPALVQTMLNGSYGLVSLGLYSFIWAFPVVMLIGLSVSVTEDSGIKERIINSLDPWLSKIGLRGDDLLPILSGFGCNVVAVIQSRSCSNCTRKNCISTIAFGSACSYQIGATLSIFSAAGYPELFAPYLILLFATACLHTRIWQVAAAHMPTRASMHISWLQLPRWRAVNWALRNVVAQFLRQAMPLFLLICLAATLLNYYGIIDNICYLLAPAAQFFHLPAEALPGIVFSLLRKDGLLVLNQDNGLILHSLSLVQLIIVVWLASTLMACLVTIITIAREVSCFFAASLVGKQACTSLLIAALISLTLT